MPMDDDIEYNAVAHLIGLWLDGRNPLHAMAKLYEMGVIGNGGPEYIQAAEMIDRTHTTAESTLVEDAEGWLQTIRECREKLANPVGVAA